MLGMDHRLGEEPVLPRGNRLLPQTVEVVDVGRDGIDGDDAGRRRADQAEIARQQERPVEASCCPVPRRAERSREVLGAPHHAPQPRAHVLEVEQLEDALAVSVTTVTILVEPCSMPAAASKASRYSDRRLTSAAPAHFGSTMPSGRPGMTAARSPSVMPVSS